MAGGLSGSSFSPLGVASRRTASTAIRSLPPARLVVRFSGTPCYLPRAMSPDLPKLLRWARDSEVAARAESAALLREHLDSPDAVVALTTLIQDAAAEVVGYAAASLTALAVPGAEAWRAVSAGLHAESGPVRDACCSVLASWGYAAVGLDQFVATVMQAPRDAKLARRLLSPDVLQRALDLHDL